MMHSIRFLPVLIAFAAGAAVAASSAAAPDRQLRQRTRERRGDAHVFAFDITLDRAVARRTASRERYCQRRHGAGAQAISGSRQRARPRIAAGCPGSAMRLPVSTS